MLARSPVIQRRLSPRRTPSEPRDASLWPPVHYARHGGAPWPNLTPSGPLERQIGFPRRARRRGAVLRRPSAAARGPARPWSSDLAWTIRIRSRTNLILALRSRSNSLEPPIPLQPGPFAKEPLQFSKINPRSFLVQKKFQFGPESCTNLPKLSRNGTHSPEPAVFMLAPRSNV